MFKNKLGVIYKVISPTSLGRHLFEIRSNRFEIPSCNSWHCNLAASLNYELIMKRDYNLKGKSV